MTALVCGVDEAGRGPVLGPMVLAAVWVEPARLRGLRRAGVRDSKALGAGPDARGLREQLAAVVRERAAHVATRVVEPEEIDRAVLRHGLDRLERAVVAELLSAGPPAARVWADGRKIFGPLAARFPALVARDRADARHVAVGAASLVAKDLRDRAYLDLAAGLGDLADGAALGMGYVNAATRRLLAAYAARHGRLPPGTRLSWDWPALREILGRDPRDDLPAAWRAQPSLFADRPGAPGQ